MHAETIEQQLRKLDLWLVIIGTVHSMGNRSKIGKRARQLEPVGPDITPVPQPELDFVAAVEQRATLKRAALVDDTDKPRTRSRLGRFVAAFVGVLVVTGTVVSLSILWVHEGRQLWSRVVADLG